MAVWCKKGTFTKATATGIQSLNLGTPEQGKAIFIWSSNGQTAAGKTDGMQFSFGMADANEGFCYYGRADDNQATQDTAEAHAGSGAVIRTVAQSQADENTAFVSAWTATGINLNWTFNDGVASVWHYMVFGGSGFLAELTAASTPGSTGNVAVTSASFRPKFALIACGFSFFAAVDLDNCQFPNLGVTDGSRHGAAYVVSEDTNPTDTHRYQRTDRFMVMGSSSTGAPLIETTLTSLDADGFTHNFITTSANLLYRAMCFGGDDFQVYVGSNTQPTATGTQSLTSTGVSRPVGMIAFSVGAVASTSLQTEARFSLGAADLSLNQGYVWCGDTDNVSPSVSARELNTTALIAMGTPAATGSSSTTEAQASVTAFNNATVDLNWGTADATGRQFIYAVFGGGDLVQEPEGTPTAPFVDGEVSHPLTHIEVTLKDLSVVPFAEVDLNDADAYYAGFKRGWVTRFLPISRGLSDWRGQGHHLEFGAQFSDAGERYFRNLLNDATNKYLPNRPLDVWMIGDEERRQEQDQRLLAVGFLTDYGFPPNLGFEIRGSDWMKRRFSRRRKDTLGWQFGIIAPEFSAAPDDVLGMPCPIWYGELVDLDADHLGAVPVIYTGIRNGRHEFLVGRLAYKSIDNLYLDNVEISAGTIASDWWVPGTAKWTADIGANTYVTLNATQGVTRNYTVIYGEVGKSGPDSVADGTSQLTLNIKGVEDAGDGTGTLITSIVDQWLHFMNVFIALDPTLTGAGGSDTIPYRTAGDHLFPQAIFSGSPGLSVIDEESFTIAKADLAERTGGTDYVGAGGICANGEELSAEDAIALFAVSADLDWGFNRKGQFMVSAEPYAEVTGEEALTDILSIIENTFAVEDRVSSEFFNYMPFAHTKDYTSRSSKGYWTWAQIRDQQSIDGYEQYKTSPRVQLDLLRSTATNGQTAISDGLYRKLFRFQNPRRVIRLATSFGALKYELGDIVPITHVEGISATGWTENKARIISHEVYPTEGIVQLECYDMEPVWAAAGTGSPSSDGD